MYIDQTLEESSKYIDSAEYYYDTYIDMYSIRYTNSCRTGGNV
nr:MAG TPA: hypothetical protein [Caudoviricetes sp.]